MGAARFVPALQAPDAVGAVVVVEVLRAFTAAAYAVAAGALRIWLVESADEAVAIKASHPGILAMGENHVRRIAGFDFSNSPVELAAADLNGCDLVQRTNLPERGVSWPRHRLKGDRARASSVPRPAHPVAAT